MIEVTVADLISPNTVCQSYIVILWDETNRQILTVYVGVPSGETIGHILTKTLARPMTLQFMTNMLQAADVNLKSVRIELLEEDIYYAVASLDCNGRIEEVDARPSDAIALALLMSSPIYVNKAVMEQAAIKNPPGVENAPVGRGLSKFKNEYKQKRQKYAQKKQEGLEKFQQMSEEEKKATSDFTFDFLFDLDRA